jgi:hypothetical protein
MLIDALRFSKTPVSIPKKTPVKINFVTKRMWLPGICARHEIFAAATCPVCIEEDFLFDIGFIE